MHLSEFKNPTQSQGFLELTNHWLYRFLADLENALLEIYRDAYDRLVCMPYFNPTINFNMLW